MGYISILPFEEENIDFAYELIMIEGWNYTKEDVKQL